MTAISTDVLIVGAGPVGLTLALDLGRRGVRTLLVEKRERVLRLPRMERSNPRTMETYRRLGVVERIRAAAYPAQEPMDILILRSMTLAPLVHQVYPTVEQARRSIERCEDGSLPREPYQLVSQYTLEEVLLAELARLAAVELRLGTELTGLSQDAQGIEARLRRMADGAALAVRARYAVGCDGANSLVRETLGIPLEGAAGLGTVTNIFFRCDELLARSRVPRARHYLFAGLDAHGGAAGSMVVQDDRRHFANHLALPPGPGVDFAEELRRRTDLDIRPEILFAGEWKQNMLVAERHSAGRVFLAGDSNHVFIPAGGLGMNTGIIDAVNLGWKLAAVLGGWGGPQLLESYDIERGAVARRNLRAVAYAVEGVVAWRRIAVPPLTGDASRDETARVAYASAVEPLNRRVYEMHGTELGYRYESAVICGEAGAAPPDESYRFRPTTWPGAHLPHVWLGPGESLYDRIGAGFTLLRVGPGAPETSSFESALRRLGVPLQLIDLPGRLREVMQRELILLRPDLHVAWRGDAAPADPAAVASMVVGR